MIFLFVAFGTQLPLYHFYYLFYIENNVPFHKFVIHLYNNITW